MLVDDRVEDGDDVRVEQLARERGFAYELAFEAAGLGTGCFGVVYLDRDVRAAEGVVREIDPAGRPLPELSLDLIFAYALQHSTAPIASGVPALCRQPLVILAAWASL